MRSFKIICVFVLLYLINFNVLFAQNTQPTPYQKQQLKLSAKWFQILSGYKMTMASEVFYEKLSAGKEANDFVLGLVILNYAMTHPKSQCKTIFTHMNTEFKQAEKLKNATDFRLEKEEKDRKVQEEKERKLRTEQEAYDETDVGSIQKNIKTSFEKWNQKREFEKEVNYTERLKTQSQTVFDSICLEQIKMEINNLNTKYWEKELSIYNSESEFFIVYFKINDLKWQNKINVPFDQALSFKNNWSDLNFEINDYDWCFVDNRMCPTFVTLQNSSNMNFKFPLSLENQFEISYSFNNLGIDNPLLKGYIFKYSNAKVIAEKAEKEKHRLDSLELTTYNQKLDSILNSYNRQLLDNPYNVDQKIIVECKKVTEKNKREFSFNSIVSSIKYNYKKINYNFERELRSTKPLEFCKIYYNQYPEKKTEADKKYIECRCDYPQRLNFDIKFIEGSLYNCNCRENEYQKNGGLFLNKDEFNSYYDKGDDILQNEVQFRILKKEEEIAIFDIVSNVSKIEKFDFKDIKLDVTSNELPNYYYQKVDSYRNKPYYSKVIDILIEKNKGLNKEWSKKGELFSNKVEFYEVFTAGDYKKILKGKSR